MKPIYLLTCVLCLTLAPPAWADDPKARAIMEQVEARDDGDHQTGEMQMLLIDRHGNERLRNLRTFAMDKGEDTQRLIQQLQSIRGEYDSKIERLNARIRELSGGAARTPAAAEPERIAAMPASGATPAKEPT